MNEGITEGIRRSKSIARLSLAGWVDNASGNLIRPSFELIRLQNSDDLRISKQAYATEKSSKHRPERKPGVML